MNDKIKMLTSDGKTARSHPQKEAESFWEPHGLCQLQQRVDVESRGRGRSCAATENHQNTFFRLRLLKYVGE
jgi:hypothetical protein